MRIASGIFAVLGLAGSAHATDQPRRAPQVGAELTYKTLTSSLINGEKFTIGYVAAYIVTSSDGLVAEGRIRPVARIIDCESKLNASLCERARADSKTYVEGGLTIIPISPQDGEALAAQSSFKMRYFLIESRQLAMPAWVDSGDLRAIVSNNVTQCDAASLEAIAGADKAERISLSCTVASELSGPGLKPPAPKRMEGSVTIEATRKPDGHINIASGEWDVQTFAIAETAINGDAPNIQGETLFSAKVGAIVQSHAAIAPPNGGRITIYDSELIRVGP